jgi:hypothetical protein
VTSMSVTELRAVDKKIPGDGRDRGFCGRYKGAGGNYRFRKQKFTGECEDLKDCVFDCEDEKQASVFGANFKNYLFLRQLSMRWEQLL